MLIIWVEAPDFAGDGFEGGLAGLISVLTQSLDQGFFSEFVSVTVRGFGDAVGVERENVAGAQVAFSDGGIPVLEQAQERGRGIEALAGVVGSQENAG